MHLRYAYRTVVYYTIVVPVPVPAGTAVPVLVPYFITARDLYEYRTVNLPKRESSLKIFSRKIS
eukprot:COSAG01_NODE_13237_length_1615_cov_1.257256_1_plen_63_part_10